MPWMKSKLFFCNKKIIDNTLILFLLHISFDTVVTTFWCCFYQDLDNPWHPSLLVRWHSVFFGVFFCALYIMTEVIQIELWIRMIITLHNNISSSIEVFISFFLGVFLFMIDLVCIVWLLSDWYSKLVCNVRLLPCNDAKLWSQLCISFFLKYFFIYEKDQYMIH